MTASVAFAADTDATGNPNVVAALDFRLTFDAAILTATGVRVAPPAGS